MLYRNIRRVSDGQWVDVLFTVDGDAFSVDEEEHRISVAVGLGVRPNELETLDSDTDQRTGTLLPQSSVEEPPEFHWLTATTDERLEEIQRRLNIPE